MTFWEYVKTNALANPHALRLAAAGKDCDFDVALAITQIEVRRRHARKFADTLAAFPEFIFPSTLAAEQATSDALASYHTSLVPEGLEAVDLTAGLGIDALHMASRVSKVVAVERNEALTAALAVNAKGLKVSNLEVEQGDCRELVDKWAGEGRRFGVAFIDPARRSADGGRVFGFHDCEPDVAAMMPQLRRICSLLIIKASPMLDVAAAIESLGTVPARVIALGTPSECKELIFIVDFEAQILAEPVLEAVTLTQAGALNFAFMRSEENSADSPATEPDVKAGDVMCEPYPAVMKMSPFKLIARTWGLSGFGNGTHLFYCANAPADFPGRTFKVLEVLPYASKVIKRLARRYPAAQVAVRNFGMTAEQLAAKLSVRQGDSFRIFGITDSRGGRRLIVCGLAD